MSITPPRPGAFTLVLLVVALAGAACGSTPSAVPTAGESAPPTSLPTATPTATPSPSPTPEPTATPTATPRPTLKPTATPKATARPTPTATPRPTPKPTPAPTASPAPTAAPSKAITHASRTHPWVAFTFDMGGRVGDAEAIVAWLVANGVPATIFMTGAMAENTATDAGRHVLAAVDASSGLLGIGNHTYSHPDLRTLTDAQIGDEIRRGAAALARYCADDPRPFFRPPYGYYNTRVLAAIGAADYRDTIMWDDTTDDWRAVKDGGPTADELTTRIVANAQNGSIILMHLGGYHDLAALPAILAGIRAKGLEPVSLGKLLGLSGS